jgi:peptidoglycan/LPS O-acetylase OafA/YrhL
MGVLLCLLVFVNAVYQDGSRQAAPYPAALRALIAAALALMPVLAALALWAVALRVRQYGWTHERIWAVAIAGVLMLYALGYAWAALERDAAAWLQRIGRINPAMSWLVMALLVLSVHRRSEAGAALVAAVVVLPALVLPHKLGLLVAAAHSAGPP